MHQLLPFIEQDPLWQTWDHFNFGSNQRFPANPSGTFNHPECFTRKIVKTLVCPSNLPSVPRNTTKDPASTSNGLYFLTSYYGNSGTRSYPRMNTTRPSLWTYKGDGMFYRNKAFRMADVLDGTSNTLFFGERYFFDPVFDTSPDVDDLIADWGWVWFGGEADAHLATSVPINFRLPQSFLTSPSQQGFEDRINAFGSGHPGGANFAMADGSVRFIQQTISPLTFQALGTKAGVEPISNF